MKPFFWLGLAYSAFFLPGLFVARWLHRCGDVLACFCYSLLALFYVMFLLGLIGIPIGFVSVALGLLGICGVAGMLIYTRGTDLPIPRLRWPRLSGTALVAFLFLLMNTALLWVHTYLRPETRYDSTFRWNFLAERILATGHFRFYPPYRAEDFTQYFYTDGIAPLVSFGYAWLYAAWGRSEPAILSLFAVMQFGFLGLAVFSLGKVLSSQEGGVLALLAFLSSPLIYFAVAFSHESTLVALSLVLTFLFLYRIKENQEVSLLSMAAAATALGILAREYAWSFIWVGFFAMIWLGYPRKEILRYTSITIVLALPWFVRNALRTGNPLYDNPVFGLFPTNFVHQGILRVYQDVQALDSLTKWTWVAEKLIYLAPFQMGLGLVGLVGGHWKRFVPLIVAIVTIAGIWILSVGYTAAGLFSNFRFLFPALVLLSVSAGVLIEKKMKRRVMRNLVTVTLCLLCFRAFCFNLIFPLDPVGFGQWKQAVVRWRHLYGKQTDRHVESAKVLKERYGPTQRILSSDAHLHAACLKEGMTVVPVWSPEVRFLFDGHNSADMLKEALLAKGISLVMFDPASRDTVFLERVSFFQEDRHQWQLLFELDSMKFYQIL